MKIFYTRKPAIAPSRRGMMNHALRAPRRGSRGDEDFLHPKPAIAPSRRGVMNHALLATPSRPSFLSQGVMNHAPTGSPMSVVKIQHYALHKGCDLY